MCIKKILLGFVVILISVLHVHLSIYTQCPLNPLALFYLIVASFYNVEPVAFFVAEIVTIGIQCVVTSCIAYWLLKWGNKKKWMISFVVCTCSCLFLRQLIYVNKDTFLYNIYYEIYSYTALEDVIIYSMTQIIYVTSYFNLQKSWGLFKGVKGWFFNHF